ncbi:RING/U-box superfamily protein [Trifolium repens]|nr:RING/U-box superfamily protein [Trifolium repens]
MPPNNFKTQILAFLFIYIFHAVVNTSIPQEKKKRNCGDMEGTSSSSTTHDYHVEEEIFPISDDEKYAEEIQLQQVLIFSAISNTNKEIEVVDVDEIHNVNNTLLRKLKLKEQETFEGESSSSSSQLKQYSYCDTIVGVDCKEFQSLKDGERGSEDLMAMELAKNKRWKRCPKCSFYVEKSEGCTRISCRCGNQFCYGCGSTWNNDSHYSCATR